jgi:hypothetical protein
VSRIITDADKLMEVPTKELKLEGTKDIVYLCQRRLYKILPLLSLALSSTEPVVIEEQWFKASEKTPSISICFQSFL